MNLKSLRLFRLIVLHGSLASAAERLHLSQSAASRLIGLLEDEIRLKLFTRARRRLLLTPEGELFFQEAEQILMGVDEIPRIAEDIRGKNREKFTLVTSVPLGTCLVSPTVSDMRRQTPDFDCRIHIEGRFEIENKVARRRYNLGLISLPITNAIVELQVEPVLQVRVEALLPRSHPLAAQDMIRAEDLVDQPIVSLQPHQLWRRRLDEIYATVGAKPRMAIETTSTLMVQQLVRDGNGLSIMDRTSARLLPGDSVVFRPIAPERWVTYACIFPPAGRPPLADLFVDCLRGYVRRLCREDAEAAPSFRLLKSGDQASGSA
ncbi:LysR family transcriptional regulator [Bordetella petrii]|uniref:LysR family transcriptional regulator n=1 Tax=Bordetella petrii TaxID=94624 RepID=UPI001E4ABC21|nr:LysR family transcriptional regulator [Bordetella petrii]MCD0505432.1 LysR family transcriptional regulator [Bordetella petrii]